MTMGYKPPIDAGIYADDVSYKIGEMYDGAIMEAVLKVKVDVDKEELLKALEYDRGQYEAGYEQGRKDAKATWIPCSERLPEGYEEILMCDKQGNISTGGYCGGEHPFEDNYGYYMDEVIAWQPLPEPYKEGEQNG